jgi:putative transposase
MKYDPNHHHRRSIRLRGHDYSQIGTYFVTLCTQDRACLFGDVADGRMRLNDMGRTAEKCWIEIPDHFPHVRLDAFVIMPNHVHGILLIDGNVQTPVAPVNPTTPVYPATPVGANNYSPQRNY